MANASLKLNVQRFRHITLNLYTTKEKPLQKLIYSKHSHRCREICPGCRFRAIIPSDDRVVGIRTDQSYEWLLCRNSHRLPSRDT